MIKREAIISPLGFPGAYYSDYSLTGSGDMSVIYFERIYYSIRHGSIGIVIQIGPLLAVSGLEKAIVEHEAEEIINHIGESDDPESVQQFIARLKSAN